MNERMNGDPRCLLCELVSGFTNARVGGLHAVRFKSGSRFPFLSWWNSVVYCMVSYIVIQHVTPVASPAIWGTGTCALGKLPTGIFFLKYNSLKTGVLV
jgi:hypothetical protein